MKHLKTVFKALLGLSMCVFWSLPAPVIAQTSITDSIATDPMDSVEVSLLTCQPHDEVYSLYGHTALRFHDMRQKHAVDAAFNYGVFNFKAPHFVLRFVFGLTDYELGAYPYELFLGEYRHFGSMVTEQVLNLTSDEKRRLRQLLSDNLKPENSVYRYNYFSNNCTTKARDIIEACINGRVEYAERKDYTPTYRDMVHQMTDGHPWMQAGNDLLLGVMADCNTSFGEREFLPQVLMTDFDNASIKRTDGTTTPLVSNAEWLLPSTHPTVICSEPGFPLTPTQCAWLFLAIVIVVKMILYLKKETVLPWFDYGVACLYATVGLVLLCMVFSEHPTVRLNLQILVFNPLLFFLAFPRKSNGIIKKYNIASIVAILCIVIFFIGNLLQDYAEGMNIMALTLLLTFSEIRIHTSRR